MEPPVGQCGLLPLPASLRLAGGAEAETPRMNLEEAIPEESKRNARESFAESTGGRSRSSFDRMRRCGFS